MLKQDEVILLHVPKYRELKVKTLWSFVKEIDNLLWYFPDYDSKQLPGRDFIFKILSTLQNSQLKTLIKNSRDVRSIAKPEDNMELIVLQKDLLKEIEGVLSHKSNLNDHLHLI